MELVPHLVAGLDFPTLPQQLVNGILLGAIYALMALGYTMVYGVLRLINFAHGEVYMFGAYIALFVSYALGFRPDAVNPGPSSWVNLLLMLLASMVVCAIIGVAIERFAYRPMRKNSRIASLITAIGVSLLLQYGGALFLPNSPQPSISEKVNPFRETQFSVTLVSPPASFQEAVAQAKPDFEAKAKAYQAYLDSTKADPFNLPAEGKALRTAKQTAETNYNVAQRALDTAGSRITVQAGQIIILITTLVLMLILRHVVLFTKSGRAMRAVSLDFDSASLMGINVNSVITIVFVIGSSLAGAGAMMTTTFYGTPLSTFYGMLPGVKAFVAAVLGGIGNIPGAVLGGLLMGVAEILVVWAGYSSYRDAIAFVILIVVLLFKPGGLLGSAKVEKV
ncbi:MAG: branched-chain amino acid ABC transporter permease [Fimbriimonas sp.]